ncbi:MAG: sensor histidine kinase [Boseongicola sp.]|nr:sensor histidine kinase [Boseongicola sp.]
MQIFTEFSQYMPHGMCLLWQPWLVILWAGSDVLIAAAYFAIPIALLSVVRQRDDLKHRGLILLFAGFITLCGLTHLLSVVTLWYPIYPAQGLFKLLTGIVSATTAVVLFRLVPTLVAIPSRAELELRNARLSAEIESHDRTLAELRAIRDNLEIEVAERTAELQSANTKLATVAREAVHRSRNLLSVVGSIARQSARGTEDTKTFIESFQARLAVLADATATVLAEDHVPSADLGTVIRKQLEPVMETYGARVRVGGAAVATDAEAAQQISLVIHELATNAQKYGGLAGESGEVELTWQVANGEDDAQWLHLRWQETLAEDAARLLDESAEGFGTKLTTRIVPAMLKGTADRKLDGNRLTYELNVPLSSLNANVSGQGDATLAARIVDRDFGHP